MKRALNPKKIMVLRMKDYITALYDEIQNEKVSLEDAEELDPELFQRAMGLELIRERPRKYIEVTKLARDDYDIG